MNCPHCGSATDAEARFCGVCGRATAATEPSQAGQGYLAPSTGDLVGREIAGRYRVVAKLGEGGMGAVYRGEQISLKRKVAIKVLRPELSADPGLVRRFNSEAELVAKLSHPNTVNIYDFGQDPGGALFIAMEFLEGRSLRQVVTQDAPLPPVRALAIARQIASSLSDAHAHGIVHRDLKPDNVMLTERGKERDVVRVLDFGIAKLRDDNRSTVNAMTRAGDMIGTPQYMAPEQIRGETVDGRTDVYALGAILYEMITARLPFEGTTVLAILSKHLTETPPAPSARRPELGIPPAIDHLVMAALAKDPAQRPPSMDRFSDDMLALGQALGGSASAGFAAPSGALSAQQPIVAPSSGGSGFMTPGHGPGFGPPGPPPVGAAPSFPPSPVPSPVPFGRPPGVPRSYPPGVLQARPQADGSVRPVPVMHGAPPHGDVMTPPVAPSAMPSGPPHYPMPVQPRGGSLTWLWILLGVLAAGGIAAGVVISQQKKGDATDRAAPADPSNPDRPPVVDEWKTGPTPPPAPTDPDDPPHELPPAAGWSHYEHPAAGWAIDLPPGFPTEPTIAPDGTNNFLSTTGGPLALVSVLVSARADELTEEMFEEASAAIITALTAELVERGWVDTDGTRRYRAIARSGNQTVEMRFFEGDGVVLIAMYLRGGQWDRYAAERTQFFESVRTP